MNARALLFAFLLPAASGLAHADTYNFDSQAAALAAPSGFSGTLNSPLVIGNATFGGGQLLQNETGSVDETGVYATSGYGTGYPDELTITFATGVNGISLLVTNNTPGTIYVSDNVGDSTSQVLGLNGSGNFTLDGTGITFVTITEGANAPDLFDFALDNVTAPTGAAPSATPEPGTAGLLLTGAGALAGLVRRRRVR